MLFVFFKFVNVTYIYLPSNNFEALSYNFMLTILKQVNMLWWQTLIKKSVWSKLSNQIITAGYETSNMHGMISFLMPGRESIEDQASQKDKK